MLENALVAIGRVIGKPKGWERVVRAFSPPGQMRGAEYPKEMAPGYVFSVDPGTLIGWNVHFFGTYEPEVRDSVARALRTGAVAFDVGANVGWHTLLMAALVGDSGRVLAFEANPTTRARLEEVVERNRYRQVRVDGRAVADLCGEARFEAPPAGDLWDGTGHLVSNSSAGGRLVPCVTIDAVVREEALSRLDLIKIDVEGWELPVLRGARAALDRFRPEVIFEYDPAYLRRSNSAGEEILSLLSTAAYEVFALRPGREPSRIERFGESCGNFLARARERGR